MGKKTTFATAVLFAMGTMGTSMASQIPSNSSKLDLPLPDTFEYAAASNSIEKGNIVVAAVKKKATKKKIRVRNPAGKYVGIPSNATGFALSVEFVVFIVGGYNSWVHKLT